MTQEDANNTKTTSANTVEELVGTCQGFPYQPRDGIKHLLHIVSPYVVSLVSGKLKIDCTWEWIHTNQIFTFGS